MRITREEFYKESVILVSRRSTCPKKQVGSVLLDENRIIAMGYNGVLPDEDPLTGWDPITGITNTVHAEANLIAFCAKNGIRTEGTTLWLTLSPCRKCAELIVQSGIKKVIFLEAYRDIEPVNEVLVKHGVEVWNYINGLSIKYNDVSRKPKI